LSLWEKSRLSTVRHAFTIITIFTFLSKLTKEGKASRREKSSAGTARPLFCLQEEQDAPVASWPAANGFLHAKPARLWKTACISTGLDVQKTRFSGFRFFVQHRFSIDTMLFQPIREHVNR
jgi:hypothetical protein